MTAQGEVWVGIAWSPRDARWLAERVSSAELSVFEDISSGYYFMRAPALDTLDENAKIRELAEVLFNALVGLARIDGREFGPLGVGHNLRQRPSGVAAIHVQNTLVIEIAENVHVVKRDEEGNEIVTQPQPTRFTETHANAAAADPIIREALALFAEPPAWDGLRKVFEVVEHDLGQRAEIWQRRWVLKREVQRFAQTATKRRHARSSGEPPHGTDGSARGGGARAAVTR